MHMNLKTRIDRPNSHRMHASGQVLLTLLAALCLATTARASEQCTSATGEPLSGQLDIVSWNIQKASNEGWEQDLAAVASEIDLAFIQEASVQAHIPEVLASPLHQAFAQGYTTAERETGVMTLSSRAPSLRCRLTSMEPWLGTPKATSVTRYDLAEREDSLLAINLHAVNFTLGTADLRSQLRALAELLSAHVGPIILAGDLNTWSDERQLLVDRFTTGFGLAPVAFEPDLRTTVFGRALDHIYIRGMHAQSASVVPVDTSDHNPLLVRLSLN